MYSELTFQDYCLLLQKHIKLGKSPTAGEHRHIDTVEFWKEQYSKLYLEKRKLEERIARLELLHKQDRRDGVPCRGPEGTDIQTVTTDYENTVTAEEAQLPKETVPDPSEAITDDLGSAECRSLATEI